MSLLNLVWPQYDKVSYEVPLISEKPIQVCLGIVRKKNLKSVLENNPDLKYLCRRFKVDGINENIVVLAENEEILTYIFDKNIKEILNFDPKALDLIHITDMKTFLNV